MYVPTNIAAPTATYAPVTVAPSSAALAQSQAVSSVRQTELALTGLGPALIPNTAARPQQNLVTRNTTGSMTGASVLSALSADASPDSLGATLSAAASQASQPSLLSPRPAYIAAQFLAQNLSPAEVEGFFAPSTPITREAAPQQNQLRDMRTALGMDTADNRITIRQPALMQAAREVPQGIAFTASPALQTQIATQSPDPVIRQERRVATTQAYGSSAYAAANALLASAREVDTSL